MLEDMEIFKLDGYNVDEEMEGGSTSCIKLKFSTGEELKASWHAENPELSEIKDFLDKIIEEEIPGLELDPKTASPSKYQDINHCIHTFKYIFPKQKRNE